MSRPPLLTRVSGHKSYVTIVLVVESLLTYNQETRFSQHEKVMRNHFDSDLPSYSQPPVSSPRDNDACSSRLYYKLYQFSTRIRNSRGVTTYYPSGIVRADWVTFHVVSPFPGAITEADALADCLHSI